MGARIIIICIKMKAQKYIEFMDIFWGVLGLRADARTMPGGARGNLGGSLLVLFNIPGNILGIHTGYIYWVYILGVYTRYNATARVTPSRKRGGG